MFLLYPAILISLLGLKAGICVNSSKDYNREELFGFHLHRFCSPALMDFKHFLDNNEKSHVFEIKEEVIKSLDVTSEYQTTHPRCLVRPGDNHVQGTCETEEGGRCTVLLNIPKSSEDTCTFDVLCTPPSSKRGSVYLGQRYDKKKGFSYNLKTTKK